MSETVDLQPVLNFLDGLRQHNEKAWFEANRKAYETARATFEVLVNGLIEALREPAALGSLAAKDCIFRVYRDLRFSKDKTPYKTNLSAYIAPGGRKASRMGFYLSLEPGGQSMLAGGLYGPTTAQLTAFRRLIAEDAAFFKELTADPAFVDWFGAELGEKLASAPQGYSRSHPEIELLRLKQVAAMHHFSDAAVCDPGFPAQVLQACRLLMPFLDYLEEIIKDA